MDIGIEVQKTKNQPNKNRVLIKVKEYIVKLVVNIILLRFLNSYLVQS